MDKKLTGYVICHGHMDIEWYMPLRSYRFWTVEALDELRRIARETPGFGTYVLDGAACVLDIYLGARPGARRDLEELIESGKLSIGPFYSQFDEWIPSPEAIVRNCLYGNRRCREYGRIMKAGYLPDNFGHPRQLPQILLDFGIGSLLFMRGMPEVPGGHPDEFIYEGLDGSRVLASHLRDSYAGLFGAGEGGVQPLQPRDMPYHGGYFSYEHYMELTGQTDPEKVAGELLDYVLRVRDRYPSGVVPILSGCDHCPPQAGLAQALELANAMRNDIRFTMGSAEDYVREVKSRLSAPATYREELIGSRYQYVLLGALSTRGYIKRGHFAAEVLLERYAEPLDAMASMLGQTGTRPQIDEAWTCVMLNSAHDGIHGSSMDEVHVEMEARYAAARQIAAGLSHGAIAHIGRHMERWWGDGPAILTFAPADAGRPQLGQAWLPVGDEPVYVSDRNGNALPTQVEPREPIETNGNGDPRNGPWPDGSMRSVLFLAGCRANSVGSVACLRGNAGFDGIAAGDGFIENEFIRMEVSGSLIDLLDKRSGLWRRGLNLLEESADAGDAWDYSPPWTPGETVLSTRFPFRSRLIESGPVRATVEISGAMSVPKRLYGDERSPERTDLPLRFEISLERFAHRLDVRLTYENYARDHRIRLVVPAGVRTRSILSQSHFGILERPVERTRETEPWLQPPTQVLPFREWLAAQDGRNGLAVAAKGLYGYEAVMDPMTGQPSLCLTLLRGFEYMGRINTPGRRGPASRSHRTPGAQCLGVHTAEWSYIPYACAQGDRTPFMPEAQNFLYPMMAHMVRSQPAVARTGGEFVPFEILGGGVRFSAFRQSYDGNGYVLRFYENQGRQALARIRLAGFGRAFLSNMNEEKLAELPVRDQILELDAGPYKVLTVLLEQPAPAEQ